MLGGGRSARLPAARSLARVSEKIVERRRLQNFPVRALAMAFQPPRRVGLLLSVKVDRGSIVTTVFSRILDIDAPAGLVSQASGKNPAFEISFTTDGAIPFPQVVLRAHGREHLVNGNAIRPAPAGVQAPAAAYEITYLADVPAGLFGAGHIEIQVEGCRKADIRQARRRRLDQGVPQAADRGARPAGAPADGDRRPGLRAGAALFRHPQAHASALLRDHRSQLLGRRKGRHLRLAGRQLHRLHSGGGPPVYRRRPAARRAVDELERLTHRATRSLRPLRPVRWALRPLEPRLARRCAREDRAREP